MDRLKNLAEWMAERNMQLDQLLNRSGLEKRVVTAILKGNYTSSPRQRERLASALGLAVDEVAWGQGMGVDHIHGHGPQFGRSP
ncbi:MAG: helix-turn-helix transcriptional regulator [Gemmataceae bacterium]|nr:helix-turn-helix transcriptional regulator [Gemmataceae bacterium]